MSREGDGIVVSESRVEKTSLNVGYSGRATSHRCMIKKPRKESSHTTQGPKPTYFRLQSA